MWGFSLASIRSRLSPGLLGYLTSTLCRFNMLSPLSRCRHQSPSKERRNFSPADQLSPKGRNKSTIRQSSQDRTTTCNPTPTGEARSAQATPTREGTNNP